MAATEITRWRGYAPPPETETPRLSLRDRWLNRLTLWRVRFEYNLARQRNATIVAREARDRVRADAQAANEIARIEHGQAAILRREMRAAGRAIVSRLTQLEFARISSERSKTRRISRVKFAQVAATPSAFYLRVDTARLPRGRGVTTAALSDPEVLSELSLATGAVVEVFRHYERGFWFVVNRSGGVGAIPAYVEYDEVWRQIPKSAGPLDVPLGIGANRKFYHSDITEWPHGIIAGTTGFGKSVLLHNIIVTVIQRNRPERVKLVMIDLAGGAGMGPYTGIPHLLDERRPENDDAPDIDFTNGADIQVTEVKKRHQRDGFVIEPVIYDKRDDVIQVLRRLNYLIERRFQQFARAGTRDISGYNHKNPSKRLPLILVVMDEIQNVMLDRGTRGDAENLLTDIASRSRKAGLHLLISTQRPSADVITGLIKANFPARIAFTTASAVDSRVILDSSDAADLGRKGLMIFQHELRRYRCQGAFISEAFVTDVVAAVMQGEVVSAVEHAVGKLDMVRWALAENDGGFTIDAVYRAFRPRGVVYNDVKAVMTQIMHGVLEVDGKFYRWRRNDSRICEIDDGGAFLGEVTIEEIARWALTENEGRINKRALLPVFQARASAKTLMALLQHMDERTLEVDGQIYHVARGAKGVRILVSQDTGNRKPDQHTTGFRDTGTQNQVI